MSSCACMYQDRETQNFPLKTTLQGNNFRAIWPVALILPPPSSRASNHSQTVTPVLVKHIPNFHHLPAHLPCLSGCGRYLKKTGGMCQAFPASSSWSYVSFFLPFLATASDQKLDGGSLGTRLAIPGTEWASEHISHLLQKKVISEISTPQVDANTHSLYIQWSY